MLFRSYSRLMVGILAAALAMTGGCRSRSADRIRVLEAERSELTRQNDKLKTQLAEKAAREAELQARAERAEAMLLDKSATAGPQPAAGSGNDLSSSMNSALQNAEGMDVRKEGSGVLITMASDVNFASGRADLSTQATSSLSKVARVLKTRGDIAVIRVQGHTDSDPIRKSGWESNQQLSEARADKVKRFLVSQGIPDDLVITEGFGESRPVAENSTKANKARNRRVEILIQPMGK